MQIMIPVNEAPPIIAAVVIMCTFDVIVVALRFYVRRKLRTTLKCDDWLALSALIMILGLTAVLMIGVEEHAIGYSTPGFKEHGFVPLETANEKIKMSLKVQHILVTVVIAAYGMIKLSIILYYKRIFVVDKGNWRDKRNAFLNFLFIVILLWAIAFCFAQFFSCKGNISNAWNTTKSLATKCINTRKQAFAFATSDFITDVIILVVPIPMIWKLRLPTGRKVAITAVFLIGLFATIISFLRMLWVHWAVRNPFNQHSDSMRRRSTHLFWYYTEATIGLFTACLPSLSGFTRIDGFTSTLHTMRSKLTIPSRRSSSASDVQPITGPMTEPCTPTSEEMLDKV
jgi:hypothetical protein